METNTYTVTVNGTTQTVQAHTPMGALVLAGFRGTVRSVLREDWQSPPREWSVYRHAGSSWDEPEVMGRITLDTRP